MFLDQPAPSFQPTHVANAHSHHERLVLGELDQDDLKARDHAFDAARVRLVALDIVQVNLHDAVPDPLPYPVRL